MKHNFLKPRLSADKLFFRHFLQIFLAMAVIFTIFTVYTYRNSRQIIEKEFTNSAIQDLQNASEYVDSLIMDIKYMISTLVVNQNLKFFYASPSPESIWIDYSKQVQTQLTTLRHSKGAIETIYLYSEASDMVYSSTSQTYMSTFDDRYWLEQLNSDNSGFSIFPYAMRNMFPYVICVAKEFTVNNYRCAIAVMVNLTKIPILKSINENSYQNIYLISDSGEIIYRYKQDNLTEPLDTVEYLSHYTPDALENVYISSDSTNTYSFAQIHSVDYAWSYVLITHLLNYTARLSTQQALLFATTTALIVFTLLFAIFFTMRSLKPIQNIREFLESPELLSSGKLSDSADIKYIAGRITQYIQTNQLLKNELQERLDLLNESQILALQAQINPHFLSNTLNLMYIQATDALGYDHSLPQMILDTSTLIRYAIEPSNMVSLETELSQTDIYLSILQQRYDKKLKIIHEIDSNTQKAKVPRLFIQPIIENAVFHGFSNRYDSECLLTIRCCRRQARAYYSDISLNDSAKDFIMVQIQDNGKGICKEKLEELQNSLSEEALSRNKNIGLRNVVQRMNLIYSDQFSLNIKSSVGEGTCFTLTFPYVE